MGVHVLTLPWNPPSLIGSCYDLNRQFQYINGTYTCKLTTWILDEICVVGQIRKLHDIQLQCPLRHIHWYYLQVCLVWHDHQSAWSLNKWKKVALVFPSWVHPWLFHDQIYCILISIRINKACWSHFYLPGLRKAASMTLGRLVAPITIRRSRISMPSISVNSWATTRLSREPDRSRCGARASYHIHMSQYTIAYVTLTYNFIDKHQDRSVVVCCCWLCFIEFLP